MKRLLFSFLTLALLNACGHQTADEAQTQSASAANPRKNYRVVSYPYTPFIIRDGKGNMTGFEIEVLQAIAKQKNIQFEFIPMQVQQEILFDILEKNKADLISAGMYANANIDKRFTLSQPYMYTEFVFLNHQNSQVKTFADLKGKKVAFFQGSTAESELRSLPFSNEIKLIPVQSVYEAVKEVINDQADVAYGDYVVMSYYANQFKQKGLHVHKNPEAKQHEFIFLIGKNNTELLTEINTGLSHIKNNGTLEKIKEKWLNEVSNAQSN